jgi:succinoglycan biosynthesis transport protein ExoP
MNLLPSMLGPKVPLRGADQSNSPHPETAFDLSGLLQLLMVRKRIIIGTAAAVIAFSAITVFRMTPLYDATVQVMLDQRENKVTNVSAVLAGLPNDPTSVENQISILRSRGLMSRVVDKLHLDADQPEHPSTSHLLSDVLQYANPFHWIASVSAPKTKEETRQARRDAIIDGLLASETVTQIGQSSAMSVKFRAADPDRAAATANAIADAYVEDQLNAKFEATQKTTQWLADRLQELSVQTQTADAAIQQYKVDNNIQEVASGGSIVDQQMVQLTAQQVAARSDLAAAQAKYTRVRQLQATDRAEDVAQVFQSGMIEQLRQQQGELLRQKAQLSTVFGPRHPKMLDIESQLRSIDSKIAAEVNRVVETVANDVAVASAHVQSLQSSIAQIESQSTVQNRAKVKLSELQTRAASAHQLYEVFLGRFKETQGQEGIQTPDARIISRAVTPVSPTVPNKTRAMELGIAGGLILGVLLAFLVERLDAGFRTVSQVEQLLGVPVLASLPEISKDSDSSEEIADRVIERPMSSFTEAMRGLQMGLVLSNVDQTPKVILVTSSVPDEGKTTVSLSLARIISRTGKRVVILDGDFRRPKLSGVLRVPEGHDGLVDVLLGKATLQQCLVKDPKSNVMFLSTNRIAGNPPDLLGSIAMEKVIKTLAESFDAVIIDSAPLLPVNDTKVLARLADAVLFVIRWEKTPRIAVVTAAKALADINAPIAGIALSRADNRRFPYYNFGYQNYSNYNKYYSG